MVWTPLPAPAHIDGGIWPYQPATNRARLIAAERVRGLTEFERIEKLTMRSHSHAELETNLVLRGEGTYLFENREVPVGPGSLVWIPPECEHFLTGCSRNLELWVLSIRLPALERALGGLKARATIGPDTRSPRVQRLTLPQTKDLAAIFADAAAQRGRSRHVFNLGLAYVVARAWTAGGESAAAPDESSVHPAVLRAARLLREEPETKSLDVVAKRSGISRDHLSRLFAQQMGVPLFEFRNRARVERFLDLFGTGRAMTLTAAALSAGFGSYAQFQRVFKKHCGQSPAAYSRTLKG